MPFGLYLLGLAVFAQGTSEFMLSGLVPDIAREMGVSVPAAGSLTSAFAIGMVVGAPLMAVLARRWSRRAALLGFLGAFLVVHVVGAVTDSFAVLLVTRVVGALANAGFLAVAVVTAVGMVDADAKGRATSVLLGGVTVACVAGVPGGAVLGQLWGWRAAFWAVVVLSVPALFAIVRSVPGGVPGAARASVRGEVRALRAPRLQVALLLGALVNGATFCTFTFLAPLVTSVARLGEAWVPLVLALFGFGSFVGVAVAGRIADARPGRVLVGGGVALLVGWGLLGLTAGNPVAAVVLAFVQGVLSFGVGSTLISRVLYEATDAPTLAGGFATAAFNVGGALGPWLGGLAIGAGLGYRSPVWVSVVLVGLALVVGGAARRTGALTVRVSGDAHADGVHSDDSGRPLGQPSE
ncbi:Cmx/CmrA family chloramphenicol efflux MFS transporter [Streptomyces sp. IB201691-2A2]|uniref:Cmx/CmrA family chloramphenicol efflux MFS transporter n=1 Tax=Streptomyces sp. IB201691-2A2 TaxID=2561920 RepID=UPI00117FA5EC|nr:Cmx/CmrA family chloramphenicol efflux MFS transporter [Streptomyces sp. IB201691-2A2]TRO61220.1 MFS transporter [Streptomyces sp. IB201691-2A2]